MPHVPSHLEGPPEGGEHRSERLWAWVSLATLALVALVTVGSVWMVARHRVDLPQGPGNHGPLPSEVRAQVLALVEPHLEQASFTELNEGGMREFRLKGKPRALLSMDFHRAFRPIVARQLRPLLAPYGEVLSFDIASLDLPPVRLRAFGEKK